MGGSSTTGPDLIRDTTEKVGLIRKRLLTAQSRHKSYADKRRRPLEFEVGDHVFLKVMPKRGVVRFDKQGNLSSWFIGPFEVLDECLKHSDYTRVSLAFSCCFGIIYIVLVLDSLFSFCFRIQA